jgi:hypothetical protein
MSKRIEAMHERLAKRLTAKEHEGLLTDVLEWFDEGGAKKVREEMKKQAQSIRKV